MVKKELVLLFIALSVLLVLVNLDFVFSVHTSSPGMFTLNTSYTYLFNITINNTNGVSAVGNGNITQINITLPTGFTFNSGLANSNESSLVFGNFTGNNSVLSWTNATEFLMNGSVADGQVPTTNGSFWFNLTTPSTPGIYNLTVISSNATDIHTTNLSVRVQSTVAPLIYLISPTNGNETQNPSGAGIIFTFNVSDASSLNLTNCTLYLGGAESMVNATISVDDKRNITVTFTNATIYNPVDQSWYVNCTDSDNIKGNSAIYSYALKHIEFNGTTRDEDGNILINADVNISVINMAGWTTVARYSTRSNASGGGFNLTVWSEAGFAHQLSMRHRNTTYLNYTDFISKSLPPLPASATGSELQRIAGTTFYLTPAGTINITANNGTGSMAWFTYQIKDTRLSYPIAEEHTTSVLEVIVYVPRNRNYTIMIYPTQSMPVSYTWTNFTSTNFTRTNNYNYTLLPLVNSGMPSNYTAATYTLMYQFNLSMTSVEVRGYFNFTTSPNWSANYTVIPYLMEGNNIVHSQHGIMPYNLSTMRGPLINATDFFNSTSGWYNMSLPATAETSKILLFAVARNGSVYYGGFKNLSFDYGAASYNYNFTAYGLIGEAITNITMNRMDDVANNLFINISAARKTFSIVNATGTSNIANLTAHVETDVAYAIDGSTLEFTWLTEIAQRDSAAASTFALPLLNITGVKEIRVFASGGPSGSNAQYAPRTVLTKTAAQIISSGNITLKTFNPGDIQSAVSTGNISIALYMSNTTCDVPIPPTGCLIGSSATMATFNPMQAVFGGGKISFRMSYGNITVHYVNVDMLASGPPDASFDSSTNVTTGGTTTSFATLRFGSSGPKIYDYALVAMPYSETAGTGLNDLLPVNITISQFYDDDWKVMWSTLNGTSATNLAGNYSHYSSFSSQWAILMGQTTCYNSTRAITNSITQLNSTMPCWVNQTDNRVWIRIPHFSGTAPTITGGLVPATTTAAATTAGGGGGAAGITYQVAANEYQAGTTRKLNAGDALKYSIGTASHTVTITSFTNASVSVSVASNASKVATIKTGETQNFELTGDDYYDTSVKYNGIVSGKASITIKAIHEKVVVEVPETPAEEPTVGEKIQEAGEKVAEAVKSNKGIVIAVIILAVIIAAFIVLRGRNKKRY